MFRIGQDEAKVNEMTLQILDGKLAAHSSVLAWEIPWTEEPGGIQSIKSQESDVT